MGVRAENATNDDTLSAREMRVSADRAAVAALRELPEALILVFDREMHFVVTAGQALERLGNPSICREGEPVRGA